MRKRCPFPASRALPPGESAAPVEEEPYGASLGCVQV